MARRLLLAAAAVAAVVHAAAPPLVVVSFDGLAHECLTGVDGKEIPNFVQMRAGGAWAAAGMTPAFPSLTCPNHYTLATGRPPAGHGILGNDNYDPRTRTAMSCRSGNETKTGGVEWVRAPTLWARASQHGLASALAHWPGEHGPAAEADTDPRVTRMDDADTAARVAQIGAWVRGGGGEEAKDLVMAHFADLDRTVHGTPPVPSTGSGGGGTTAVVRAADTILGDIRAVVPPETNLVVVSDRGMTNITRVIAVEDIVPNITAYTVGSVSPLLMVYTETEEDARVLYGLLHGGDADLDVYRRADIPAAWGFASSDRVGDVVALARLGVAITLTAGEAAAKQLKTERGEAAGLRAIWMGIGPAFRAGVELDEVFDNTAVFPLLCGLLNIDCGDARGGAVGHADDASRNNDNNNKHDVFTPVLRRSPLREHWIDRDWVASRAAITIYPPNGTVFSHGTTFDLAVIIPHALPGADPEKVELAYTAPSVSTVSPLVRCANGDATAAATHTAPHGIYTQHIRRNCTVVVDVPVAVHVASGLRVAHAEYSVKRRPGAGAKNVILVVGDGMSLPMITATRLLTRGRLPTDDFDHNGIAFTKSLESIVTDSAASATALNTGHKTFNGGLGVYPDAQLGTQATTTDNPRVETFAEYVRRTKNMRVGVVTTASLLDATPAGVWAHCAERHSYTTIAQQGLDLQPDVMLGGGEHVFAGGQWQADGFTDDPKLLDAYAAAGYTKVTTAAQLAAAVNASTPKLLGLFAPNHLHTANDRRADANNTQPSLPAMATAALALLDRGDDPRGFYLMVEAASIDKQAHGCDYARMFGDSLELQETLAAVGRELGRRGLAEETLVVVTSDHATGGYDVYGTVDTDGARGGGEVNAGIRMYGQAEWPDWEARDFRVGNWETAQWTFAGVNNNHPSYREDFTAKREAEGWLGKAEAKARLGGIGLVDNLGRTDHEEAHDTAVHTSSDVMVFARGRGSALFEGAYDNTDVFHKMVAALGEAQSPTPAGKGEALAREIRAREAEIAALRGELSAEKAKAAAECSPASRGYAVIVVIVMLVVVTFTLARCYGGQLCGGGRAQADVLPDDAEWPSPSGAEMDVIDDDDDELVS